MLNRVQSTLKLFSNHELKLSHLMSEFVQLTILALRYGRYCFAHTMNAFIGRLMLPLLFKSFRFTGGLVGLLWL